MFLAAHCHSPSLPNQCCCCCCMLHGEEATQLQLCAHSIWGFPLPDSVCACLPSCCCCAAVADSYMPARIKEFTPQQLQTSVVAWNKLGFTNPAVAAAAVRLSEVLPHLAPEFPDKEAAAGQRS